MGRNCRDCPRCTEAFLFSLVFLPFRFVWWAMTFWNIAMLKRRCPQCGHWLAIHHKIAGRFTD